MALSNDTSESLRSLCYTFFHQTTPRMTRYRNKQTILIRIRWPPMYLGHIAHSVSPDCAHLTAGTGTDHRYSGLKMACYPTVEAVMCAAGSRLMRRWAISSWQRRPWCQFHDQRMREASCRSETASGSFALGMAARVLGAAVSIIDALFNRTLLYCADFNPALISDGCSDLVARRLLNGTSMGTICREMSLACRRLYFSFMLGSLPSWLCRSGGLCKSISIAAVMQHRVAIMIRSKRDC